MRKKKSSFFTFCFSMIPGAGEMYLGFMKRGLSIMGVFSIVLFVAAWLNLPIVLFAVPIIWFFGFFDTHNIKAMTEEEFLAFEDSFQVLPELSLGKNLFPKSGHKVLAWVLIVLGVGILWNNLLNFISWLLPWELYNVVNDIPQYAIGILILVVGIRLILGKKKQVSEMIEQEGEKRD
jgi:ABC-type enterochelin transport system permease subunit